MKFYTVLNKQGGHIYHFFCETIVDHFCNWMYNIMITCVTYVWNLIK